MLTLAKKILPKFIIDFYYRAIALAANIVFRHPSEHLIVIGVTGTNGKSSTVQLIAEALAVAGKKVGFVSTAEIKIGDKRWLNDLKMTMPGRFILQKFLRQMVDAGCEYAVVETSSQGIEQYRHLGINYDVAVFTNLAPEHIEAHGGFENYKAAKGRFFAHLTRMPRKHFHGQIQDKISIVNLDDPHAAYFLGFKADKHYGYGIHFSHPAEELICVRGENISLGSHGSSFTSLQTAFSTTLLGEHNIYNCLAAISSVVALGIAPAEINSAFENVVIPGRLEFISEGQDFSVMVDYAPEPQSLSKLYKTLNLFEKSRIIHVLGSCGGGRDAARRPVLGRMAGRFADFVVVTNEDPYDDDPMEIIDQVFAGAVEMGKIENKNVFKILDRREAIKKAFTLAQAGDLVLLTGKACEQAIVVAHGKKIPWDDRRVAREELKKVLA